MISAVAFCPHPPLLVPDVAQGAADELDEVRAACRAAIVRIAAPGVALIVLGRGDGWRRHPATARGSLAGFGVALEVPLGSDAPGRVELPLSLTIGAWLLRDALGPDCGATGWSVGDGPAPATFDTIDAALLVMGDGSARRSTSAPGYLDERAAGYDEAVASALKSGDADALRVDAELGGALLAAGPRTWNVAARLLAGRSWVADLLYDAAPYGVGYVVATWTAR